MVSCCVAYGCHNIQDRRKATPFHKFPFSRPRVLKRWINAIRRKNWYPSKTSKLCGQHFLASDYQIMPGCTRLRLKPDAVPSIFSFPKHLMKKVVVPRRKLVRVRGSDTSLNDNKDGEVENVDLKNETLTVYCSCDAGQNARSQLKKTVKNSDACLSNKDDEDGEVLVKSESFSLDSSCDTGQNAWLGMKKVESSDTSLNGHNDTENGNVNSNDKHVTLYSSCDAGQNARSLLKKIVKNSDARLSNKDDEDVAVYVKDESFSLDRPCDAGQNVWLRKKKKIKSSDTSLNGDDDSENGNVDSNDRHLTLYCSCDAGKNARSQLKKMVKNSDACLSNKEDEDVEVYVKDESFSPNSFRDDEQNAWLRMKKKVKISNAYLSDNDVESMDVDSNDSSPDEILQLNSPPKPARPKVFINRQTQTFIDIKVFELRRRVKTLKQRIRKKDLKISAMKDIINKISKGGVCDEYFEDWK